MGHSLIDVVKGGGGGSYTKVSTPESGTAVKKTIWSGHKTSFLTS